MATLLRGDVSPKPGDLVLARVDQLGKHQRIELVNGRRARIFPGDRIIVAYGNRYAPDQFEALVGNDLSGCDLVASGGIASTEVCRHERISEPTRIMPEGIIGADDGRPLNLSRFAIDLDRASPSVPTVLVTGTAMNSGKTMTAGSLVRGFRKAGLKVAGLKVTGTGSGNDLWFMSDMGAHHVFDFTDAGFASTYKASCAAILRGALGLMGHAGRLGCDVAVVEIADGLQHEETAELLACPRLRETTKRVVFACSDSLGAVTGVRMLRDLGYRVLGLGGQISRSPLAVREAERAVGLAVYSPLAIQEGALLRAVLEPAHNVPTRCEHKGEAHAAAPGQSRGLIEATGFDTPLGPAGDVAVVRSCPDADREVIRWLEGGRQNTGHPAPEAQLARSVFAEDSRDRRGD